eukprot:6196359-Pleurochrysis_carterae.AAC.3
MNGPIDAAALSSVFVPNCGLPARVTRVAAPALTLAAAAVPARNVTLISLKSVSFVSTNNVCFVGACR